MAIIWRNVFHDGALLIKNRDYQSGPYTWFYFLSGDITYGHWKEITQNDLVVFVGAWKKSYTAACEKAKIFPYSSSWLHVTPFYLCTTFFYFMNECHFKKKPIHSECLLRSTANLISPIIKHKWMSF